MPPVDQQSGFCWNSLLCFRFSQSPRFTNDTISKWPYTSPTSLFSVILAFAQWVRTSARIIPAYTVVNTATLPQVLKLQSAATTSIIQVHLFYGEHPGLLMKRQMRAVLNWTFYRSKLAPRAGLEPTTYRLTPAIKRSANYYSWRLDVESWGKTRT